MNATHTPQTARGLKWFYYLYKDGMRSMSRMSRWLWIIVVIKLFIMFAILRPFFFPRVIAQQGDRVEQIEYVQQQLTNPISESDTP